MKTVLISEEVFIDLLERRIAENVKSECLPDEIWKYFIVWIKKNLKNIPVVFRDPFYLVDNAIFAEWRQYSKENPPPEKYIKIFRKSKIVLIRWYFPFLP